MKFLESVQNINRPGKQSIEIRLKKEVSDFYSMLLEHGVINYEVDTGRSELANAVDEALMMIDGQCCESDYFVTTDEDESHDFKVFMDVVNGHQETEEAKWTKEFAEKVWNIVKPYTEKRPVTWG